MKILSCTVFVILQLHWERENGGLKIDTLPALWPCDPFILFVFHVSRDLKHEGAEGLGCQLPSTIHFSTFFKLSMVKTRCEMVVGLRNGSGDCN